MRYCKKCVQPDTRPGIKFDDDGVCYACKYSESHEADTDWAKREGQLREIAEWAKKNSAGYDCAIGVSGGKDSTFQVLYARDRLGLNVLLTNCEPDGMTDVGRKNRENLVQKGFDIFSVRNNPRVMRALTKRSFFEYGNPVKPSEYPLWAVTYQIALAFKIPLIIQGENAGITLGVTEGLGNDENAMNVNLGNTLAGGDAEHWVDGEIRLKDLLPYQFPRKDKMKESNIRAIYLNYFAKEWSFTNNTDFAVKNGLSGRPGHDPELTGRLSPYCSIDSDMQIVNQMLKYYKLGFGFVTDEACYYIREGRMTREEGIELVRKYDGKCGEKYINDFCEYIDITVDEFWRVANSFRGPMWKKSLEGEWVLDDPIWEQEDAKAGDKSGG
ncbi:N-acetyl sugar amidotransferase [Candidatus Omnitrophota bacterium]